MVQTAMSESPSPGAGTSEGAAPLTAAEIAKFRAGKAKLQQALKEEGQDLFQGRSTEGRVGIRNQGATCYLNSLLQGLFHTIPFRQRLYAWRFSPEAHGDAARSIPLQLQKVFAELQLSVRPATSTKALTGSFGWTSSQSFQQHDVQEMLLVLVDALDRSLALSSSPEAQKLPTFSALLSGRIGDSIRCLACDNARCHATPFIDLDLPVPSEPGTPVSGAVAAFLSEEVLGAGDAWECDKCGVRGGAKAAKLQVAPPVLLLHLKRFSFDFRIMRRVKLHTVLTLERTLDLSMHVADAAPGELRYELYGVMIHLGSAMGGHYFAYINPYVAAGEEVPEGATGWLEFNDSGVKPLSEVEVQAMFAEDVPGEVPAPAAPVPATPSEQVSGEAEGSADGPTARTGLITIGIDAGSRQEAAKARASAARQNAYMLLYRRADATALSGLAADDAAGDDAPPPDLCEAVQRDNEYFSEVAELHRISRRLTTVHVYPPSATADARRMHARGTSDAAGPDPTATHDRPGTAGSTGSRPGSAVPGVRPGTASSASRDAATAALDWSGFVQPVCSLDVPQEWTLQRLQQEVLTFALPAAASGDEAGEEEADGAADALRCAAASGTLTIPQDCLRFRRIVPATGRCLDTYGSRMDESLQSLHLAPSAHLVLEAREPEQEWEEYNPDEMVVSVLPLSAALSALQEAGVDVPLAREAVLAGEPLGSGASVDTWALSTALASAIRAAAVPLKVPGDSKATVGGLFHAVATANPQSGLQPVQGPVRALHIRMTGDVNTGSAGAFQGVADLGCNADGGQEAASMLRRDHDVWPGDVVVMEQVQSDEAGARLPSVLCALLTATASSIELNYNAVVIPDDVSTWKPEQDIANPPEYDGRVTAQTSETLADVKARIAEELGIEADTFHVRRNVRAPQLKEEDRTLQDLGFINGSALHLCPGAPLRPDQALVKVYHFRPDPKPAFKLLVQLPAAADTSVLAFKRMIADVLAAKKAEKRAAEASDGAAPEKVPILPPARIRLRARKGKEAGAVFRDSTSLRSALRGKLEDGAAVAFQVLPAPETVGPGDMIITVRQWRPLVAGEGSLTRPVETVLPKRTTVQELGQLVRNKGTEWFPMRAGAGGEPASPTKGGGPPQSEDSVISLAKSTAHGLPLSWKTAKQLKWLPELELELDGSITLSPLGLRDGTTLVVRRESDFTAAQEAGLLKQSSASSGGGKSAARGAKPWQRKGGGAFGGRKETGISIAVAGFGEVQMDTSAPEAGISVSVPEEGDAAKPISE